MSHSKLKIAASRLQRITSHVEVERKFCLGPKFASLFLSSDLTHTPRTIPYDRQDGRSFTVKSWPGELIRDTYYDTKDARLSELGLWVRQRRTIKKLSWSPLQIMNEQNCDMTSVGVGDEKADWNAKLRLAGHFTNSQFAEINGKDEVSNEVLQITKKQTKLEDLEIVADIHTRRASWGVTRITDNRMALTIMTIVMDKITAADADNDEPNQAPFEHTVGEVELCQEIATEGEDHAEHEARRKQVAAEKMEALKEFMTANPELFITTPKPIGKLSAYYTWKNSRGSS